ELVVPLPLRSALRGERRRRPRVHGVGVAGETAGLATLVLGTTGGDVDARVYGKLVFTWGEGGVVDDLAVVVQAVPDGEGHPEEPLAREQPVPVQTFHPVGVAGLHERRMPGDLLAAADELGAQAVCGVVAPPVAQVPLAGGDDLQGAFALLEELHGVGDLLRFADEVT